MLSKLLWTLGIFGLAWTSQSAPSLPLFGPARYMRDLSVGGLAYNILHISTKAVIYPATDLRHNRRVALKYVLSERGHILRREYDILSHLNHPGIPQVYELYTDGDWVVLAMDLIPGSTWHTIGQSRSTRIPYFGITRYVAQLLSIVHYLHERSIGHLNIHPGSVMVTPDHRIFLIDFAEAGEHLLPTMGMPLRSRASADHLEPLPDHPFSTIGMATDYYGVASVLYAMANIHRLPGMPPFNQAGIQPTNTFIFNQLHRILTLPDHNQRWIACFVDFDDVTTLLGRTGADLDWDALYDVAPETEMDLSFIPRVLQSTAEAHQERAEALQALILRNPELESLVDTAVDGVPVLERNPMSLNLEGIVESPHLRILHLTRHLRTQLIAPPSIYAHSQSRTRHQPRRNTPDVTDENIFSYPRLLHICAGVVFLLIIIICHHNSRRLT